MRYLLIILAIVGAATLATIIAMLPKDAPENNDAVVTINGRVLTRAEIQDYRGLDKHHGEDEDFINEIITKQLLITEAQRLNIDKEPGFRLALKIFYEHSLIKLLMERVNNDIEVDVSDAEVDSYLSSFGKTFTFYTMQTSATASPEVIKSKGKHYSSLFDDLSGELQQTLAAMQPGETRTTFVTGNDKMMVYLESVSGESTNGQNFDRDFLRRQLKQAKTETQVNAWIDDLRAKASITYHKTEE
ncbi:MAG: hypothetical protein V2I36_16130 [Desulfopila sp.]|jgi:parvulin-like peptidyl-prolyl isomerase|nr:hypothetical protein [Desulfopila sp.]